MFSLVVVLCDLGCLDVIVIIVLCPSLLGIGLRFGPCRLGVSLLTYVTSSLPSPGQLSTCTAWLGCSLHLRQRLIVVRPRLLVQCSQCLLCLEGMLARLLLSWLVHYDSNVFPLGRLSLWTMLVV